MLYTKRNPSPVRTTKRKTAFFSTDILHWATSEDLWAKLTILFSHGTVFLLPSRVQDIKKGDLFIDETLFTVRILDSWVVPTEMSGLTS